MKDFKQKLNDWAVETVNFCHNTATNKELNFDLCFYAFQSTPVENPEILLLGVNPHGNGSYKSQYDNPAWKLKEYGKMIPEVFVNANPFYSEKDNWLIWKNLIKSFNTDKLKNILKNHMYMNLVYFNTNGVKDLLNKDKIIFSKNKDLSINLITEIIKPKRIVCLGTKSCFDELPLKNKETLLKNRQRLVTKGWFESLGIAVYGIPHPTGARGMNDNIRRDIGVILNKEL